MASGVLPRHKPQEAREALQIWDGPQHRQPASDSLSGPFGLFYGHPTADAVGGFGDVLIGDPTQGRDSCVDAIRLGLLEVGEDRMDFEDRTHVCPTTPPDRVPCRSIHTDIGCIQRRCAYSPSPS